MKHFVLDAGGAKAPTGFTIMEAFLVVALLSIWCLVTFAVARKEFAKPPKDSVLTVGPTSGGQPGGDMRSIPSLGDGEVTTPNQ